MDSMSIIYLTEKFSSPDGQTKHGLIIYVSSDSMYDEIYSWLIATCNDSFVTTRNDNYTRSFFTIWFYNIKYRDLFLLRWT